MAETTNKSDEKQEQNQETKKIKASVGAWWKSTTSEETPTDAAKKREKTTNKTTRGSGRKKTVSTDGVETTAKPKIGRTPANRAKKPTTQKSSPARKSLSAKANTQSGEKIPADKRTGNEDQSSVSRTNALTDKETQPVAPDREKSSETAPEAEHIDKETKDAPAGEGKKPGRKRAPRRKKPAKATDDTGVQPSSAKEGGAEQKDTPAAQVSDAKTEVESSETAELKKKPGRKRSPRKKKSGSATETAVASESVEPVSGHEKSLEVSDASDVKADLQSEKESSSIEAQVAAEGDGEDKASARQKRGGRRGRRPRKKPQNKESTGESGAVDQAEGKKQIDIASVDQSDKEVVEGLSEQADLERKADTIDVEKDQSQEGKQSGRAQDKKPEKQEPKPVIKLLINAEEPEECRLALLEDGRLESIHVATSTRTQTKNNIYKAKIVAIEANLQAAFVDYGTDKNGFLPFSEIHPEYYKEDVSEKVQKLIDQHQWKKLSITDVVERGRELLVQVVKEEVGKKGANMTTYLSLPGRCVVLMPGSDSTGISRKISGEEARSQLRDYMLSNEIPEGIGWILRTASVDITKTALTRDVNYLLRLWEDLKKKGQELEGVGLIYQDHDHVLRFLREHFDPEIQEILVDSEEALEQVESFIELLPTKQREVRVKLHRGARPIFNQYSIEDQIESIYQPRVNLPSGGSIVIDPTEALVAIDVNSGSTSKGQNFEDTIFQANMEAAKELARQLRLRDLGGLVVVDFIDMRFQKNIREVEKQVKASMKRDKAKVDISRISKFGLMQISRQKLGAPIEAGNYRVCSHCRGRGIVRSVETLALFYLRRIHTGATRKNVAQIECRFPLDVAAYLLNNKRQELRDLENKYETEVMVVAVPSFKPADNEIIFHKAEKDGEAQKRA